MILSKALLLKGLGGLAVIGGTVGLGVVGKERGWFGGSIDPALKELIEKVGLSCDRENICTQASGKTTNIKKDSNLDDKTLTTTGTSGKIKVYKLSGESTEGYNEKFKFVIEEGDITLNNGGTTNKLEQFETYEIKEEGTDPSKKWYFSRKSKSEDEIKKALGLPADNCTLGANTSCSDVEVDTTKIAAMKFDGLTTGQTPSISANAKLTATKLSTSDADYPLDYKFELKGKDADATLTLGSKQITLKSTKATEFKIKVTPSSDTTPVSLSLEKAWTAKSLGEKVGLICTESSSTDKSCTLKDGSINVNNGNGGNTNSKIEGAKVKDAQGSSKKITYEENQADYNQGIKFYLEGDNDIALTNATNGAGSADSGDKKICKKGNGGSETTYEIKKDSSDSKWYLTKYTAS